jgi:hypothetical protein
MPNSYRIRTDIGTNKVLQVNLDQDFDKLEILSLSIFPNDVYTRSCADFGVICGRVFANRGLGLVNARVSVFIPIFEEDELNPIISTLYPYKSFEDFNEDGYKYNLLPYSQSYSGHVPVGTFPDRLDALVNPSVIEVYDKYYKFTAKTNDAGDFMIFGVPVGQHELFMQVDLSDIGEFSLAPQDLIRMGRAVESQVNGTKFKFSENYSELPQIVTLRKTIQVAPFYGEEGVCQHYIVRADFDLTSEASIELKPTAIFMGSLISTSNKKKLKRNCKIPSKQGWLCDLIAGPGQIECIRQTIFTDDDGRPLLEEFRLENDGKLIDENGAWVIDVPMNLDYIYTDENGIRRISPDGSAGVPIRARYRFKVKWQQSTSLREENRRGYFLVPNVKEWGWTYSDDNPNDDPGKAEPTPDDITLQDNDSTRDISGLVNNFYIVTGSQNVSEWTVTVNGVVRPDLHDTFPMPTFPVGTQVIINYTLIDSNLDGFLFVDRYTPEEFQTQSSYAFSLSWADYGTTDMIQEAVNCEDRFYEFSYNKVYTVSQLIDRYSTSFVPQKSIQIKYVNDDACEGVKNPFPVNDAYYRYSILFILFSFILEMFKFIFIPLTIILHVLALLWPIFLAIIIIFIAILNVVIVICNVINAIISAIATLWGDRDGIGSCPEYIPINFSQLRINPFKNIKLPLFLYTEDGCTRCRCNIDDVDLDEENNSIAIALQDNAEQYNEVNVSNLANLTTATEFEIPQRATYYKVVGVNDNYRLNNTCNAMIQGSYVMKHETHSSSTGGEGQIDGPGLSDTLKTITNTMLVGWNSDERPNWVRLPIFQGNDGSRNIQRFSLSMTIAEKLNLFNTKAKYFDNITNRWNGNTDESISPGNTGWNQIKVTWNSTNNANNNKFHFDNVLVLVYDTGTFNEGDILTFQDPSESQDGNINETLGIFTPSPLQLTVSYANPDFEGTPNNLTTTYTMPFGVATVTGTTCYPMDIEYFQVIKTISYDEYILATNHNQPFQGGQPIDFLYAVQMPPGIGTAAVPGGDAKFSLPYRFLRSNGAQYKYWGACNGGNYNATPQGQFSRFLSTTALNNSNRIYTRQDINSEGGDSGFSCKGNLKIGMCFDNITWTQGHLDDWGSFTNRQNLRIMFVSRGVDPNSQSVPMKYDLRRLFGSNTDYSNTANIRRGGSGSNDTFDDVFVNQYIIFTNPQMKLNIPIQASNEQEITNPKGLILPYHEFFTTNDPLDIPGGTDDNGSLPLFYPSYNFNYINSLDNPYYPFPTKMPTYYSALSKYSRFLHGTWNSGTTVNGTSVVDSTLEMFGDQPWWEYRGIVCVNPNNNAFSKNLIREIRNGLFTTGYPYMKMDDTNGSLNGFQQALLQAYPFAIPSTVTVLPYYNAGGAAQNTGAASGPGDINTLISPGRICGRDRFGIEGWNWTERCADGTACSYNYQGTNNQCWSNGSWNSDGHPYGNGVITAQNGGNPDVPIEPRGNSTFCGTWDYKSDSRWFHTQRKNTETNDISGYFGREYVEGGSVYIGKLTTEWDYNASPFWQCPCGVGTFATTDWWTQITSSNSYVDFSWGVGNNSFGGFNALRQRNTYFKDNEATYFSPVYAGFTPGVPVAAGYNAATWHVDPDHTIQMTNPTYRVFRTDRLPSSTQITNRGFGNSMLLHQNAGFAIFKLENCEITQVGGGDVELDPISVEVDTDFVPGGEDGPIATVLESLSSCGSAVDLNSYYINGNNPAIRPENPYSSKPAAGADYLWFDRDTGCYNLVSKPFVSLFNTDMPDGKKYSDIRSIVEWVQRLKLTFAMCFDILSQTFSNNWVNGTLYAFSFQMATFFNDDNEPYKDYCKDTIFFNRQIKNFFYRSSPYDGNNFVGKLRYDLTASDEDVKKYGNLRNLLFPTTILDMGPKNEFIQELVASNDYDGYIVNKVPATSYQDVSNVTNLFVLSRFVNASFWQLLFPVGNTDDNGNTEGSDDPAIGALFKNSRWQNGQLFANGLLPGLIDADFSQMISINSEFGVKEYGPELYGNNTIYFGTDGTGIPVFGLFYSADTQDRDYISPRRTIYNSGATLPFTSADTENITTFTQDVPFYKWNINMVNGVVPINTPVSNTIFGQQSNNFVTNPGTAFFSYGYQDLDRVNGASDYFRPSASINTAQYYNAFISNYDSSGNAIANSPTPLGDSRYTFAAPYHFYFGLVVGGTAMDVFITKYVDTTLVND